MSALYRLIHAEKANYPIVLLCRVLHVARSSYYAWREGEAARQARQADDDALAHEITVLHIASHRTYWVPRIHAELRRLGRRGRNTLMESTIGLFKTELIKPQRPWKTLSQVELATAEWVDWYNHRRLHGEIGHVPPVEYESQLLHRIHETQGHNHSLRSLPNPGRFTIWTASSGTQPSQYQAVQFSEGTSVTA
ncbi:integrase core domain-containing protein [Streptomyces sp. NPDC005799]|uniref:integrase core domain-containing protein n=1 Tax=Streptomyces sp. NPDC005799 TaxID=3154678 RepID=UPI0033EEFC22